MPDAGRNVLVPALERLFERYLPRVKLIVRARTGSIAGHLNDRDDLAQKALEISRRRHPERADSYDVLEKLLD